MRRRAQQGVGAVCAMLLACLAGADAATVPKPERFGDPLQIDVLDGAAMKIPAPGAPATVLLFLSSDCPIANKYAPEIRRIQAQFEELGVVFLRVYDDRYHDAEDLRAHTETYGYTMPAALDTGFALVKRCGATVTPEAAVLDAEGGIAYRGRIDDRFVDFGRYRQVAKDRDLIDALAAVLQGDTPPHPRTKAIGCFIPESAEPGMDE